MKNCVAKWKSDTQYFQLFSVMETFLHQRDQYGNLVPGFYDFDIEVFEKDTNLSMPISDLNSKEIVPGIMLFSFGLTEPGNFKLMISDNEQKNFISNMPFEFTVFIGYCDGRNSFANGSGLNDSVAGEASIFSVVLRDSYQYPSPIKLEYLQVDIVHESGIHIKPVIFQIDTNWNSSSNMFEIVHTPEKSGLYAISVICGNIPLNGGHPFTKRVLAGDVDLSLSGVVNFSSKVPKMIKNEIVVRLMDSFSNPILLQQPKLKLEISSINKSDFSSWNFSNSYDGMYTSSYLVMEIGTYEICASLDGQHLLSCPFSVNAYNGEYFPKAYDDEIYVLEDESIAFNVLDNDYLAGSNASIIHFSKPTRGSLLQYGLQYRYTPYRGYVGNDSFSYVVSDANDNLANGSVNISVFSIPPQLISFPSQLQATEDEITPKFSGFQGFEIMYSDLTKKISITLTAHHGIVSLSPILVQFWKTMWDELCLMNNGDGDSKELTIMGRLEVVNYALQSIQYLGKENFWGDDVIHVSTSDGNGVNDVDIPIFVEPINDPPFINVPKFIILKKRSSNNEDGYLIFERERDNFNFSVGDPDLLYFFAGNKSEFLVMFSLEVDSGVVSTNLPADLISSTELKLKGSYQWQSLQTFVTISRHFTVKARGIRFLGTVDNCNSIMQDLSYYQSEEEGHGGGAMLTVKINDMGNYGCQTSFCQVNMSGPLFAHADIHLIRSKPMSPFAAHSLGSAIVIGSIMVLTFGVVLLYFICKCSFLLLVNGRKRRTNLDIQPIASSNSPPPPPTTTTTAGTITKLQPTPFQQRLQGQLRNGEASSSSSKGGNQSFL
ncbi:protein GAMETE EXPRESSED 2 isoform X1 [Impatiens glandulifera]|uniref:protein GAMETE EXPRESSED 2 isoform X1 n=1 Tax=Impatiens glandulifera TaxID=253017 RepID=UPI001FB0AB4B|nr:protein GAMETE EXPRESSED 2 isoform X1 [Impatiens glandulifera]